MRCTPTLSPPTTGERFEIWECDDLEELCDEVRDLLEDGDLVLDFRVPRNAGLPFSIVEAFQNIIQVVDAAPTDAEVPCIFGSERALEMARRYQAAGAVADQVLQVGDMKVVVRVGDITRTLADAIVNASNTQLRLGSGVSGAIKRAVRDPDGLQAAMRSLAPITSGHVVHTRSFGLGGAPVILHAATATGGREAIKSAYEGSLRLASDLKLGVLAIPALGTGTGALSMAECAQLCAEVLWAHEAATHPHTLILVLYNDPMGVQVFCDALGADVQSSAQE